MIICNGKLIAILTEVRLKQHHFAKSLRYTFWIGLFAGISLLMLVSSRAATPVSSFEAESGIRTGCATAVADSAASGGQATSFGRCRLTAATACTLSNATGATVSTSFPASNIVANDSGDDQPGIQAAINSAAAAGGGVVPLPTGTFVLQTPLTVKSGVKLTGQSAATTVLKAGPNFLSAAATSGGHPLITTNGATKVTLADFTADQSGDTLGGNVAGRLSAYLLDIRQTNNVLVDSVVTRNPYTYSIVPASAKNFCIINSSTSVATSGAYNQLDGIHVLNSSFGDIVNNIVDQRFGSDGDDAFALQTLSGSTVHDLRIADNKARGGSNGHVMQFALQADTEQIYNIAISGNEFWGSPAGIMVGRYNNATGSAHDVAITGNNFHDNDKYAVSMTGVGLTNITVTNNYACNSFGFTVTPGTGNIVSDNTSC